MSIKVSVIIPVYNMQKYVSECLDSVLSQTLRDIEVICINDGSSDGSLSILREYEQRDGRIKVIDKQNAGVAAARNDGIAAASGEWIAFMDPDDYYPHSEVLSRLYTAAAENGVLVAGGYYQCVYEDGRKDKSRPQYKDLSFNCDGLTPYRDFQYDYGYYSYLFSAKLLKGNGIYFPLYGRFQDPPFFVKAMIAAGRFYALDEPTYCYRQLPSSAKYTIEKTLDMLCGMTDNLIVSRENGLAKLHYITACRLNEEGSFMAIRNLYDVRRDELLSLLIRANALVDTAWLREEGYPLDEPFVLEAFRHAVSTAERYESMRRSKWMRALTWLPRRLSR